MQALLSLSYLLVSISADALWILWCSKNTLLAASGTTPPVKYFGLTD